MQSALFLFLFETDYSVLPSGYGPMVLFTNQAHTRTRDGRISSYSLSETYSWD